VTVRGQQALPINAAPQQIHPLLFARILHPSPSMELFRPKEFAPTKRLIMRRTIGNPEVFQLGIEFPFQDILS
jgi:hypothetical protein